MQAVYDLAIYPTTFDFVVWACVAKTEGVDEVYFVIDGPMPEAKYSQNISWRRFVNILIPISHLMGFKVTSGPRKKGLTFKYHYGTAEAMFNKLGRIKKLPDLTWMDSVTPYVTVTIRNSFRNTYRNSDMKIWDRVIAYLKTKHEKVEVLDDNERNELNLVDRFQLYCNASMNYGVSGGPMALCHFSDAPYLTTNMIPHNGEALDKWMTETGFPKGSQFSFKNEKQRILWEPDDYDNIIRAIDGA